MKFLFRKSFLYIYLLLLAGLYIYSLWDRVPDADDAWIGEYTYWQAHVGHAKSELMHGITNQENYLIVHHKLLTLNGALFIKLFGFSVYTLKSVSLLYFIIFLALFFFYTVKQRKLLNPKEYLLAVIFFLSFPWIFKFSFIFRPEIMLMTLGFVSFIFLERSVFTSKKSYLPALISGLFAGLGLATHLNGITLVLAGIAVLMINKKYRDCLLFILGTGIAASVYFYDFRSGYGLSYWYYQFTQSPSLDYLQDTRLILKPFVNLLTEHQRFFNNPMIIAFTAFAVLCFIASYKYIIRVEKNLVLFTFLAIIALGLFAMHKDRVYMLLYLPYLILLVILSLKYVFEMELEGRKLFNRISAKTTQIILLIFLFYYLLSGLYFNLLVAFDKWNPKQNAKITEKYVKQDPSNLNIIAPMTFIFNEIEKYHSIQAELCYTELQKADSTIYGTGFLKKAETFDIDYIFLTPYFSKKLGVSGYEAETTVNDYKVIDNTAEMMVLKREK